MNTKLIFLFISIAVFSSCTTMYKSGQTPDDVYFSPARTYGAGDQDNREKNDGSTGKYQQYNSEDRAIRLGINDARWRYLDNDYGYNQYYSPYNQFYSNYNYGFNHGYYYNPFFWPYPVYSPVFTAPSSPKVTTPRVTNLAGYGSVRGYNNAPLNSKTSRTNPMRNYNNNNNNGTAVGNAIRRVLNSENSSINNGNNSRTYTPSNNNNNNSNRSYTPSSNSSSSSSGSSSSGSSGGGISRPPRSGGR